MRWTSTGSSKVLVAGKDKSRPSSDPQEQVQGHDHQASPAAAGLILQGQDGRPKQQSQGLPLPEVLNQTQVYGTMIHTTFLVYYYYQYHKMINVQVV